MAPALAQDSGVCSRERKRSLRSQNGKGIHLDSFSNRYTLSSVLCRPLKNCPSEQQIEVISVTVQQVTVMS